MASAADCSPLAIQRTGHSTGTAAENFLKGKTVPAVSWRRLCRHHSGMLPDEYLEEYSVMESVFGRNAVTVLFAPRVRSI